MNWAEIKFTEASWDPGTGDFTVVAVGIFGMRRKTFRERWLSWPWRPWQTTVQELVGWTRLDEIEGRGPGAK